MENKQTVTVIGAGLAGSEAAWQIAQAGYSVRLFEMKPQKFSPAHKSAGFAELICSNSLKAARINSAAGLLKEEMRRMDSLLVACADKTAVPAGGALAVDRDRFSELVTKAITEHPNIEVMHGEVTEIPAEGVTVIASGPLTSDTLAEQITDLCGGALSFFDAAAPIVTRESLDMEHCFTASRYDKGDDDYINCPMNKEEYDAFYEALITAERAPIHDFDVMNPKVYEGCMPIEVMAQRGHDTIRFGPLKPVGLRDPPHGSPPVGRGAAAHRKRRKNTVQSCRIPDKLEISRAKARVRYDSRPEKRRVHALRRDAPQHVPRFAEAFERGFLHAHAPGAVLCGADDRRGGLYGIGVVRLACGTQRRAPFRGQSAAHSAHHYHDGFTCGARRAQPLERFPADGCELRHSARH